MITEETLIIQCDLPLRIEKLLILGKIYRVKDLLEYSIYDLMRFRGLGSVSLYKLVDFVSTNGFKLKQP